MYVYFTFPSIFPDPTLHFPGKGHPMPGRKASEAGGLPRKGAEGAASGGPRGGVFGGGGPAPKRPHT